MAAPAKHTQKSAAVPKPGASGGMSSALAGEVGVPKGIVSEQSGGTLEGKGRMLAEEEAAHDGMPHWNPCYVCYGSNGVEGALQEGAFAEVRRVAVGEQLPPGSLAELGGRGSEEGVYVLSKEEATLKEILQGVGLACLCLPFPVNAPSVVRILAPFTFDGEDYNR